MNKYKCPRCCSEMFDYGDWCECLECGFIDGDVPPEIVEAQKNIFGGADIRETVSRGKNEVY